MTCKRTQIRMCAAVLAFGGIAANTRAVELDRRWVLPSHANRIESVSFSPDGTLAASASADATLKLWRVADGRLLRTLVNPFASRQLTLLFAPDGATIFGGGGGAAFRWRVADGALLQQYPQVETVTCLALSPDGETLAVGGSVTGRFADVVVCRASDGAQLAVLRATEGHYVFGLVFSPDGLTLITAEGDSFNGIGPAAIRYWDLATGQPTHEIAAHPARINALALSPDGQTQASAGDDGTVRLWQRSTREPIATLTGHTGPVYDVTFSPDGAWLISAGADGTIRQWNALSGAWQRTVTEPAGPVGAVAYSADGNRWLTGAYAVGDAGGGALRIRDANGEPMRTLTRLDGAPYLMAMSPVAELFALEYSPWIEVRSTHDGTLVRTLYGEELFYSPLFSPDGQHLAAQELFDQVRIWSLTTGETELLIDTSLALRAYSPDGAMIALGAYNQPTELRDAASGAWLRTFTADPGAYAAAFSPDGAVLLTLGRLDGYIFRVSDGALLHTLPHGADTNTRPLLLAFSPTGDVVATAGNLTVKLWNPQTGELLRTLSTEGWMQLTDIAFSPDGAVLAAGSRAGDRTIRFWRVADGVLLDRVDDEIGPGIGSVAFPPDGRQFLYLRHDATVVAARNPYGPAVGDANGDGAFDVADWITLSDCLAGPAAPPAPVVATPATCAVVFDADNDGDVDLADVGQLEAELP